MHAYEALAGQPVVRVFRDVSQEDKDREATAQLRRFAVNSHRPVPPLVYVVSYRETLRNSFKVPFGVNAGSFVCILAISGARKVGVGIPKFLRVK